MSESLASNRVRWAIYEYLRDEGEGYAYDFWKRYGKRYGVKYETVKRYFFILRKAGLIELSRVEKSPNSPFTRRYYKIRVEDIEKWREAFNLQSD